MDDEIVHQQAISAIPEHYQRMISSLQEEMKSLRATNYFLLSELKSNKSSSSTISEKLLRCQQGNLRMLEELQACQYANTVLREELQNTEQRNTELAKQQENHKYTCSLLRNEIARFRGSITPRKESKTLENIKGIIDSLEPPAEYRAENNRAFDNNSDLQYDTDRRSLDEQTADYDTLSSLEGKYECKDSGFEDNDSLDHMHAFQTRCVEEIRHNHIDENNLTTKFSLDAINTEKDVTIHRKDYQGLMRRRKATVTLNEEDVNLLILIPQNGKHEATTEYSNELYAESKTWCRKGCESKCKTDYCSECDMACNAECRTEGSTECHIECSTECNTEGSADRKNKGTSEYNTECTTASSETDIEELELTEYFI